MRKSLIQLAAVAALGSLSIGSVQAAPLTFDFDGSGGLAPIQVTGFDWDPTSFLADNGVAVVGNTQGNTFTVYTHSLLTAYRNTAGRYVSLPAGFAGEITMTASFEEVITGGTPNSSNFQTTGTGWVEIFYDPTPNSNTLTGSGFGDGRLIARFDGVSISNGSFTVDETSPGVATQAILDQSGVDNYAGQLTVTGNGSQGSIVAGTSSYNLDPTFFLGNLSSFTLTYQNFSINLPYQSADPSDCYNPKSTGVVGGAAVNASACDAFHNDSAQMDGQFGPGIIPRIGVVNGLIGNGPDFVGQSDFNSPINVTAIPEPASLALMGMALLGVGVASRRRRS